MKIEITSLKFFSSEFLFLSSFKKVSNIWLNEGLYTCHAVIDRHIRILRNFCKPRITGIIRLGYERSFILSFILRVILNLIQNIMATLFMTHDSDMIMMTVVPNLKYYIQFIVSHFFYRYFKYLDIPQALRQFVVWVFSSK